MKKYKNIVFDMGNVLLDFSPYFIVSNFTQDIEKIQILADEIFYKQEWLDLDQGIISDDVAYDSIQKRVDVRNHKIVRDILDLWQEYLTENGEMIDLLEKLKLKGYKLFLFSNASKRFYDYESRFECLSYFNQKIISADLKYSKPSEKFYLIACEMCKIEPSESFFIDDSVQNVLQANQLGLDGYIYNGSIKLLYRYLQKLNIID